MQFFLNFLIDFVYILVAAVTVIIFTKRGFIETAFRFGRMIMAGLICYFTGPFFSKLIYEKWIYNSIFDMVSEKTRNVISQTAGSINVQELVDNLPFFVRQLVERDDVTEKYGSVLTNFEAVADDFAQTVSRPISSLVSNLIAYVVVFLASLVLLFVLFKLLNGIFKLPVLNGINKTLGFLLGIVASVLLMAAITLLLGALIGILASADTLRRMVEASYLFGFFNKLSLFNLF